MSQITIRFFDCFTTTPGEGNSVAIVTGEKSQDTSVLQAAAREISAPATCFLGAINGNEVHVRFFSPHTEYTMCGHAVVGLFTLLHQDNRLPKGQRFRLITPHGSSPVYVESRKIGPPHVMLGLPLPHFYPFGGERTGLADILKIPLEAVFPGVPLQVATADFVHLLVPLIDSLSLSKSAPSPSRLADYCRANNVDSVALFTLPEQTLHNKYQIREFCPAIGVDESSAAGTTNASVSCFLAEQKLLTLEGPDFAQTTAHQGASLGRPSLIRTEMKLESDRVITVRTGGAAVECLHDPSSA